MSTRYLIIGGGVAGTTAAETIRREDPAGEITVVSDEPYRFYSRIMISKLPYFTGKLPAESIWLKKESWYADQRVNLITGKKAVKFDAAAKTVTLEDGAVLPYDKLLLALGIAARRATVPGADKQGIHYVRTFDDFKGIQADIKTAKQAVVIGGGAIGFEMCEMFQAAGLEVTLSIREPHYWDPVLDATAGRLIELALEKHGIKIVRNLYVTEVRGGERVESLVLQDGSQLPCQIVSYGIGGFCPHEWLKPSGLALNRGVIADSFLETNLPDVWTAGDAAEFDDAILGERVQFGSWSNAQGQGRVAGLNMAGKRTEYRAVTSYNVSGLGVGVAFCGNLAPLPDRQYVGRGSLELNSYARLFLKNGRLVGGAFINRTFDMAPVQKLIEKRVDLSAKLKELADPNFDLKTLIPA